MSKDKVLEKRILNYQMQLSLLNPDSDRHRNTLDKLSQTLIEQEEYLMNSDV